MNILPLLGVAFLFLSGCLASPPPEKNVIVVEQGTQITSEIVKDPSFENFPGDDVLFCNGADLTENESCFQSAFSTCQHAVGVLWSAPDGFPLSIESKGIDEVTGDCLVRIVVFSDSIDETAFAGQSTNCRVPPTITNDVSSVVKYDLYSLSSSLCEGTLVAFSTPTQITT
ncbi:MAG: hypothetical protein V1776_02285 [Candidatus Diapherotrites archaeon]